MTDAPKKILIVEDHPIFRWGLSELINQEPDMTVCGDATGCRRCLEGDRPCSDSGSDHRRYHAGEQSDGIDLTKGGQPPLQKSIPILILSMHDQFLYAERALHAGAKGYIMKQEAMENVVTAIRQVLAGKIYLDEKVKDQILFNLADRPAGNAADLPSTG
jgi:DNA-binding NarL/FixJ family response regulator